MNPYIHIALIFWTLMFAAIGFLVEMAALGSRHNLNWWEVAALQVPFILSLFTALLAIGEYIH